MHGVDSLARLYVELRDALEKKKDIFPILRDASKEDFLNIFEVKRGYKNQEKKQVEAALFILALIGIAVAAAVLTGLIAGGITYEMSKPSENLNNVDLLSEQIYLSLGV